MKIRKGDTVRVLSGKNKGKTARVLMVNPEKMRIWVEGVNLVKRHSRPTQKNPKGGVVEKEGSLHISKVMLVDAKGEPTRVGYHVVRSENGRISSKLRISKKSGENI
ncbi:MAG: 50S ribosomal protein L24 [bacterium]|nr:50S ribosomal protein L24 [bacterium]